MKYFSTRILMGLVPLSTALLLTACVSSSPTAPTVLVLPNNQATFAQFNDDDAQCRYYASSRFESKKSATDRKFRNVVMGTIVGSLAGAAIEGNSKGAQAGAGLGMLAGMSDADGEMARFSTQQQVFNNMYLQCMYSKGHRIPVNGTMLKNTDTSGSRLPPPPPPRSSAPAE